MTASRLLGATTFFVLLSTCSGAKTHPGPGFSHVSQGNISADLFIADTRTSQIHVYGRNSSTQQIGNFTTLKGYLEHAGNKLTFATNGGMFNSDYTPVGLLVQGGIERSSINLGKGDGNFFLMPNGVFLVSSNGKVAVITSEKYPRVRHNVKEATQSGPMLVINGQINPAFKPGSHNRLVRNGVGVINSHTVAFAISNGPINFWDFAYLFRHELGCKNALYLDGVISKFYVPNNAAHQGDDNFGVLIGITQR